MSTVNFSSEYLDTLTHEAEVSPRFRQHKNVHKNYNELCQRLFNAIEMNSYIRPHRHLMDAKNECLIAVRGRMALVVFDDVGQIVDVVRFGVQSIEATMPISVGVELPAHAWHTVISEAHGSVLFEVKSGPFDPQHAKELAGWAPSEESVEALKWLYELKLRVQAYLNYI